MGPFAGGPPASCRRLSLRLEFAPRGDKDESGEEHGERTALLQQVAAETLPVEQFRPSPASLSLSYVHLLL